MNLGNIKDWRSVQAGKAIKLTGDKARPVKIDVACAERTRFMLKCKGIDFPLGVIEGVGELRFSINGEAEIEPYGEGEAVFYRTVDGTSSHTVLIDPKKFTTVMQRRDRDLKFERMQFWVKQNERRRDRQLERERMEDKAKVDAALEKLGVDPETGEVKDEKRQRPDIKSDAKKAQPQDSEHDDNGSGKGKEPPAAKDSKRAGDGPSKRSEGDGGQSIPEKDGLG